MIKAEKIPEIKPRPEDYTEDEWIELNRDAVLWFLNNQKSLCMTAILLEHWVTPDFLEKQEDYWSKYNRVYKEIRKRKKNEQSRNKTETSKD